MLTETSIQPSAGRVTFILAPSGDQLQAIAYVHGENSPTLAYLGEDAPNFGVVFAEDSIQQNIEAEAFVRRYVDRIHRIFSDDIRSAISEGLLTARSIVLNWLVDQGQFTVGLLSFAAQQGYEPFDDLPTRTFGHLLRNYLSLEELKTLVRNSLRFGSGYNAGAVAQGKARRDLLNPAHRELELKLTNALVNDGVDLQFFYVDEEADGCELPRYMF